MILYAFWIPIAGGIQENLGNHEETGWAQFFMLYMTLFPGLAAGGISLVWPSRWMGIPLGVATAIHFAFGMGCHPR